MRVMAPAKINLHLRVGRPRADGFHPLLSWMCTVSLFDILNADLTPTPGFALSCDRADVPCDSTNLVLRAAAALERVMVSGRTNTASTHRGLSMRLQKRIPVGAGLGGGSSDGAVALAALNMLWQAGLTPDQLAQLAASLGSDLPFFFYAPSAICSGRGDVVRPTAPPTPGFALLIFPGFSIPTAAVYRKFDELGLGDEAAVRHEPDFAAWATLSATDLLPRLRNDLEPAAFAIDPRLGKLREMVQQTLSRTVQMSGSGSTLYTLFDQRRQAENAADALVQTPFATTVVVELAPKAAFGQR